VTTQGHEVEADALVIATNSPISDRLRIHTKQAPYRTYAVALELRRDTVPVALYWDTEDPYHYVRLHADRDGAAVLIVGGEDHKTGQAQDAEERFTRLESWARERFSAAGAVRYRWSGQVMEPVDHLAFIGRDPAGDNLYVATGDSGHGMTHGTIAGMLITDLVAGRDNAWASLYAPERKSARTLATYARENLNVARQYGDYLRPGDVSQVGDIAPGSGAVIRQGARKLAVYRDESGTLLAHSAVCTHVGCIVRWNDLEKTWDCPCHGSRFDVHGQVVNGPARTALPRITIEDRPTGRPTAGQPGHDTTRRL
jgi:Rieske Fe-S protein